MLEREITKTGCTGTIYTYCFEVDEDRGKLNLLCVKVWGNEITEVMDAEILQGVYDECYQKWINSPL